MSLLGTFGAISLVVLFYVLARLSERFGTVVKMRPLYLNYYLSVILALIGSATHIMVVSAESGSGDMPAWILNPWALLLAYHIPLAVAVTIALHATWRYWSWLITEHND
jgi:hypothetical protein